MSRRPSVIRARIRAQPRRLHRTVRAQVRSAYALTRTQTGRWQVAYLGVLVGLAAFELRDGGPYAVALVAWVVAGAHSMVLAAWLGLDVRRRRDQHDRSGLPSIRGWRLAAGFAEVDAELLLAIDAISYLFDHARLTTVPIRGSRRRGRTTYVTSLRALIRDGWGPSRGVSGRRSDRLLRVDLCQRLGLVRRVVIGNATAYRLVDESAQSALARLEAATGKKLIAWQFGRDPSWDGGSPEEVARVATSRRGVHQAVQG